MSPDPNSLGFEETDPLFCERLTALVEVIGALSQSDSFQSFYHQALQFAVERLGFESVVLRFRSDDRLVRLPRQIARNAPQKDFDAGVGAVSPPRRRGCWKESDTVAVAPIFDGEKAVGRIRVESRRKGVSFSRQQRELLRLFAMALGCLHTRKRIEAEREQTIQDLQAALARINTLHGLLPICCSCKKIRQDDGYWSQIEEYLQAHSDATFSHGICPECAQKLYPEVYERQRRKNELRGSSVEEIPVPIGDPAVGRSGENPENPPETTGNG